MELLTPNLSNPALKVKQNKTNKTPHTHTKTKTHTQKPKETNPEVVNNK